MEIRPGNTSLKSRHLEDDAQLTHFLLNSIFVCSLLVCHTSVVAHHALTLLPSASPFSSFLVTPIISIILPLAGRLKFIALASAVGVSAGLIALTVTIMIR